MDEDARHSSRGAVLGSLPHLRCLHGVLALRGRSLRPSRGRCFRLDPVLPGHPDAVLTGERSEPCHDLHHRVRCVDRRASHRGGDVGDDVGGVFDLHGGDKRPLRKLLVYALRASGASGGAAGASSSVRRIAQRHRGVVRLGSVRRLRGHAARAFADYLGGRGSSGQLRLGKRRSDAVPALGRVGALGAVHMHRCGFVRGDRPLRSQDGRGALPAGA